MKTARGSFHNLAALESGPVKEASQSLDASLRPRPGSRLSADSADVSRITRLIIVSNHLPIRVKHSVDGWSFEWDEDALVAQAKEGAPPGCDVLYVGSLPVDIPLEEQETISVELKRLHNCSPVFLDKELKEKFYKGFCKQQLWPLFHYVLPMSPASVGRFDAELWQAYVKANKVYADKLVEEAAADTDCVWIHDYHLLVLPSLLRKRFNRIRCGVFLHSPFPSSEIFRTFPKREELLRSMLNADLIGFHTFDYARHFLSCASRMLGLEHETSRGSITIEYYGRTVGIKIMPTGVDPSRYLSGFSWDEFKWRRGELLAQLEGKTVLVGVDDMDPFKGIELKLQAFEKVLDCHAEYRGKAVLVQITHPPRSTGREISELHAAVSAAVLRINTKYGNPTTGYEPVMYLERHVPLHERIAFYSVADVAVVTATRDGMNLVPYEYIVCRQGPPDGDEHATTTGRRDSMLVVSEFVGCSPSLSGAIRVNPWSIEATADGMYSALRLPLEHRRLRHDTHWRYVSHHTVAYWAASYITDLQRVTKNHATMKCYGLGLGLDTFRMVALDANFRKLDEGSVSETYQSSVSRLIFLDYDGTLTGQHTHGLPPSDAVMAVLQALAKDLRNKVCLFSGRPKAELASWFDCVPELALGAENGFFLRWSGSGSWDTQGSGAFVDMSWKRIALPILQQYQESTDGSSIEVKESALVWHYKDADPDFGSWQAKELLDHLEGVLSNKPVQILGGSNAVEIKPQGVSKGAAVERFMALASAQLATRKPLSSTSLPPPAAVGAGASAVGDGTFSNPDSSLSSLSAPPAVTDPPPPPTATSSGSGTLSHGVLAGLNSTGSGFGTGGVGERIGTGLGRVGAPPLPPAVGLGIALSSMPEASVVGTGTGGAAAGPAFVLCIGDDRSDEEMFVVMEVLRGKPMMQGAEVFACTVGQKPSRAPFYLNDTAEVLQLLTRLAGLSAASTAEQ